MKFSPDSKELALLAYNGQMKVFDTRTFNQKWDIQSLGEGRDCDFHPNGKYIAVVTGNSRISLVNVVDDADRMYVDTDEGMSSALFRSSSWMRSMSSMPVGVATRFLRSFLI